MVFSSLMRYDDGTLSKKGLDMEIKDLVGLHKLSGVDMSSEEIKKEWGDSFENCQVINFILDGVTYVAIEDPQDGYRSSMREVKVSRVKVKNKFAPSRVMGILRGESSYNKNDVVDFYDVKTAKIVLSIGTSNIDDYYPGFVAEFTPENLSINSGVV